MLKYFSLLVVFILSLKVLCAQTGKYIPTKFDTIKKVVPAQVYGRQRQKANTLLIPNQDSILLAEKLEQEEIRRTSALKKKQDIPNQKVIEPNRNVEINVPIKLAEQRIDEYSSSSVKPKNVKQSNWTLQECIAYARENNLQITAQELNERLAKLVVEQTRASRLPNVNGNFNLAETYGRSIDPTSNQFATKGFLYNTLGLQSQGLLFGWFQKKYQIEQSQLDLQSTTEAYSQLKDDVSLNVATGFLRVLLAREQVKVSESQLKLDNEQYKQTLKFVNAGKLPELNVAQMVAQVANDSANLISTQTDERISMLQLRALMNFNFEQDFDVVAPAIDASDLMILNTMPLPNDMLDIALKNQHKMKFNELRLLSAKKTLDIAKANQYPQFSVFGNLGTNFSSNVFDITGQTYIGETPLGNINIAGTSYPLTRPDYKFTTATKPLFTQYGNNIQANFGVGMAVPIFNGYTAKTNIQKAKIGLINQQVSFDSDKQKLKQDIYTAYEQARAASQKYMASNRSREAAQRALDFAVKRYEVGMINTFEYTSVLNNVYTASANTLAAKYDYMFKLKILDYYMGNPLKL
jgi:outer membrane protein